MADGLQVDPQDRDLMIRTIIGEAGGQDPEGMAGVANVIANRLSSGKYGKTGADVVLAPNQFEPWTNRGAELLGYDPKSPEYQNAGAVLDGVLAGKVQDNTGGATHFFAPTLQKQLGRSTPAWAAPGQGKLIAGQLYYAPQGPASRATSAPASQAISAVTQPKTKAGYDALKAFGVDDSGDTPAAAAPIAPTPAPAATAAPSGSFDALKAFGVDEGGPSGGVSPQEAGKPIFTDPQTGYTVSKNDQGYTSLTNPKTGQIVQQFAPGDYEARASQGGSFAAGALSGIPIAGPAVLSGVERAAAAKRALSTDTPYSQALASVQGDVARDAAVYPKTAIAGNVTGGALALAPIAATGAGATALGLRGGMGMRTLLGGTSGAALGAADSAVRGDNPLAGAAFGAVGGGVGPWAGHAIGGAVNRLTDAVQGIIPTGIPGVSRSAANLANQVIDWSGGHQEVIDRTNALGPLSMAADADPSLTAIAGGLASKPGEAQGIIRSALTARAADAGDRIGNTLTNVVGPDRSNVALDNAYKAQRSAINAGYNAVHAAAPPVDASHVVSVIDSELQTATGAQRDILQRFRNELVAAPAQIDPATGNVISPEKYVDNSEILHNLRKDLDSNIPDKTLGVPLASISKKRGAVGAMRSAIDDALKTQVPGMANLDAQSALAARNIDAVQEGYNSVLGANVPHPTDFEAALNANAPETNLALNAGMASRMHRAFGTGTQRDAVTLNKLLAGGEDGYSAQNIGAAFGKTGASNLLDTLGREQTFNNTTNSVINNSETARRTAANKLLDDTQPGGKSVLNVTTAGMVAQPIKSMLVDPIIRTIMENPTEPRNVELARILISQGGQRGQFLQQLQRLAGRNALVDRIGRPAAAALNASANRLLIGGGLAAGQSQGQ